MPGIGSLIREIAVKIQEMSELSKFMTIFGTAMKKGFR